MKKFICGTDEEENKKQNENDYFEMRKSIKTNKECEIWLEKHSELYVFKKEENNGTF